MPTPLQQIVADFQDKVRLLNEIDINPRAIRRELWVREAMTVCARAFVLHGDKAHLDHDIMADLWDWERFCLQPPPSDNQFAAMGGTSAVYRRIAEGGLGNDKDLGVWNGGFFRGLRLSGALRPYSKRQWYIWEHGHEELVKDLEEIPLFNRLERNTGRNGIRRLRRCPAAFLPPEPPDGASVVAGLFAGAGLRRVDDEDWMELPADDEIVHLFEKWTILYRSGRIFRGRKMMLVPPFYVPLFIDVMPNHSVVRLLSVDRPALCPLLPAIYWDLTMRREHLPVIPFTGALPYSCSMRTFRRKGWKRKDLHYMGLQIGINGVDSRLRERMKTWFEAQNFLRQRRSLPVVGPSITVNAPDTPKQPQVDPQTEIQPVRVSS